MNVLTDSEHSPTQKKTEPDQSRGHNIKTLTLPEPIVALLSTTKDEMEINKSYTLIKLYPLPDFPEISNKAFQMKNSEI